MLTTRSTRTLAVSIALWAVLVTAYVSLGVVRHDVLPSPYNALLMVVLMMVTLGAVVGVVADRQRAHGVASLTESDAALRAWLAGQLADIQTEADGRFAALHSVLYGVRGGMQEVHRRFDAMDAPTVVLPRQRAVACVTPPRATLLSSSPGLDPEVLDLARRLNAQMARQDE